jgi:hypothetical protein
MLRKGRQFMLRKGRQFMLRKGRQFMLRKGRQFMLRKGRQFMLRQGGVGFFFILFDRFKFFILNILHYIVYDLLYCVS